MLEGDLKKKTGLKEIGWFIALWAGGVVVVGAVVYAIRLAIL